MVYYFVIGSDGHRYGPADIDTLVEWAREGRIIDSTPLIERGTERQITADALTAIAAELRRRSGGQGPAVRIERGASGPAEAPTMTRPGGHGAPGGIPPVPPVLDAPPPSPSPMTLPYDRVSNISHRSKLAAGLLGIFLGGLGVHRFYLGYTGIGLLMLVLSCPTGGVTWIWGFVEGIICLCGGMRDADGRALRD